MTTSELRTILAAMLTSELGTYTLRDGTTTAAAITVGEPPGGATVTGMEVRIASVPEFTVTPAYQRSGVQEVYGVRVISHDAAPSDILSTVRKVLSRWSTASVTEVPANERLGILYTANITIPA